MAYSRVEKIRSRVEKGRVEYSLVEQSNLE